MCLGSATFASAQETGSISGYTFDATGTAVAGVTITVTGAQLPGARTVTTNDSGFFQVPILLPGSYTVKASKAGVGDSQRTVIVEVSRDSQVDLALGVALQESVAVTAATPRVDLRSTEVNFNFSKELIDQLPLQRTYAGLFQLIPGVAENNSFAPNGGGSRQDNTYLLDGVNITNPGFGYLSTEVNEFDIQEFSVKRGAITAEFGRASGFVTNAVTRSGSNSLSGGARLEVIPSAWIADSDKRIRSTTSRLVPSVALGGPIRHDQIFFYGSAQATMIDTTDRSNNLGPVPDREQRTYDYFGKITAAPANQHFLSASYRSRPNTDEFAGVGPNDSAAVATNNEGTNRVATATYSWFFSSTGYLDVKYLRLDEQNETVAITDLGFQPTFDVRNLRRDGPVHRRRRQRRRRQPQAESAELLARRGQGDGQPVPRSEGDVPSDQGRLRGRRHEGGPDPRVERLGPRSRSSRPAARSRPATIRASRRSCRSRGPTACSSRTT